ncbi:MAG: TetR family transcriptional regulator [Gammaproteobacteria bacterium]|nr:TetR family transcriptional regulator [Gammaproteobacteria bacterium]
MANPERTARADSMLTQERILEASVTLFSERGYNGTSMRAIADAAGVNLAAANYHFGSKAQLLEAAFNQCIAPINAGRIRRLEALQARPHAPGVEAIVRAFVDVGTALKIDSTLPRFLARLFAEPKSLSVPLLARAFASTMQPYVAALKHALPEVDPEDLRWRFHFVIGAMIHLSHFDAPLNPLENDSPAAPDSSWGGTEALVRFTVAGLCQGVDRGEAG